MFKTVSIMPGMDSLAPDRQDISNGFSVEPNFAPITFSTCRIASSTWLFSSGGYWRLLS